MVSNIFAVQRIIETGSIEFKSPYRHRVTVEFAKSLLEGFSKGGETGSFRQYWGEWVFDILGQPVSLGPVLVSCNKWHITPDDLELLKKAVEGRPADAVLEVGMTSVAGEKIEAKVPNWLPPEEKP
jgi:hypothetical protein